MGKEHRILAQISKIKEVALTKKKILRPLKLVIGYPNCRTKENSRFRMLR